MACLKQNLRFGRATLIEAQKGQQVPVESRVLGSKMEHSSGRPPATYPAGQQSIHLVWITCSIACVTLAIWILSFWSFRDPQGTTASCFSKGKQHE
eukprot:1145505-Pelagomonas_calceolata.AAC.2